MNRKANASAKSKKVQSTAPRQRITPHLLFTDSTTKINQYIVKLCLK